MEIGRPDVDEQLWHACGIVVGREANFDWRRNQTTGTTLIDSATAMDLCRTTMIAAVVLAAPLLLAGMATGLLVGLLQALTQIQDQTVAFVPKLLAMAAVMVACLPWLMSRMVEFTRTVFENAGSP